MLYLDIFDKRYVQSTPKSGIVTPSDLIYLRRLYSFNRDSVEDYYHDRNFAVKNTHILSRIVEHFPIYAGYDAFRYLEYSYDRSKYLAKHFKFTSEIDKGIVHQPFFLGNSGEEIIYSNSDDFDVPGTVADWKRANCIQFVTIPRNDMKMLMPLGSEDKSKSGLSVISVNIPMLALKYREFQKLQLRNYDEGKMTLNKNHFIIKYVLSNSLPSLVDHSLLNRIMDTYYGNELITPDKKYRFKMFDPSTQVDRMIAQTLETITSKRMDYVNLLMNIRLMFEEDASSLLCVNDFGGNRQTKASVLISRLRHMKFIYDVSEKSRDMNRHYLNDWKRLVSRTTADSLLSQYSFDYATAEEIKNIMYEISNY